MIDIHSHLLPGIDDGAETFEDSVAIVEWLDSQGVTDVIATPHYIDETAYVSSKIRNQKLLDRLNKILEIKKIKTRVYLGNEIYISDKISELIKTKRVSTLSNSRYALIELPLNEEYPNYQEYFKDLIKEGYKVILAHPERYRIIQDDYKTLKELADIGLLFQCNMGSVLGRYGKKAKKTIVKMMKDKLVFAFGSDVHRASRTQYLDLSIKKIARYYTEDELRQLLVLNPKKIIAN